MATPTVAPAPPAPDDQPGAPRRSHRYRRRRRWPRRLLIGLNVFVAVCVLGAAGMYAYVRFQFGQINRITIPGLWGLDFGNGAAAGPANALFFASGPNGESDGLFGRIDFVPGAD